MAKHIRVRNRITNFLSDGSKNFKEIELHLQEWPYHPSPHQLTGILTAHYKLMGQTKIGDIYGYDYEVGLWANKGV